MIIYVLWFQYFYYLVLISIIYIPSVIILSYIIFLHLPYPIM